MGLLYETENSLIIIGHGYYDSNNQYYLADYSANRISRMAENKDFVALLACYSSNVILHNELALTYDNEVDLKSAVDDLLDVLDWDQHFAFIPSNNFMLFDLDPGPGAPGGITDAPFSNGIKYIYSPSEGLYWNLNTEAGFQGAGNWMFNNKYILVKVYIANDYYKQIAENTYQLISGVATYDAWIIIQSDMNDYLRIRNLVVAGVAKKSPNDIKLNSIRDVLASDEFVIGFLAGLASSLAIALVFALITGGIGLINKARLATKTILITVTKLGQSVLGLKTGPYWLTVPSVNYVLMTFGIILIIIAVLIISTLLIYAFYKIS